MRGVAVLGRRVGGLSGPQAGSWVHDELSVGSPKELSLLRERRRWDLNPRLVAQHTISSRADSAALALLRDCSLVRLTAATALDQPTGAGIRRPSYHAAVIFVTPWCRTRPRRSPG